MQANGRIENIKKVAKQLKKACPIDIQLSHAHTGLARALGFADWHSLTVDLQNPSSQVFNKRIEKLSSDPEHPTFLAAVERFSQSTGVQLDIAYAAFVDIFPSALERWRIWSANELNSSLSIQVKLGKTVKPTSPDLDQ
jgi:hypothetical protein